MAPVASPARTCCRKSSMAFLGPSIAEIRAPDALIFPDVGGLAGENDPSGLEQVGMLGEIERESRVLLDDQHADLLLLVQRAQDSEQLLHDEGREPEGRLVEQ